MITIVTNSTTIYVIKKQECAMATAESDWCDGSFFDYQNDNGACKCSLDKCDARTASDHDIFRVEVKHDSRFWIVATDGIQPKIHGYATTREKSDEIMLEQKGSKFLYKTLCVGGRSAARTNLIHFVSFPEFHESFVGCFRREHQTQPIFSDRFTDGKVSIKACIKGCAEMGHHYAGLFQGGEVSIPGFLFC